MSIAPLQKVALLLADEHVHQGLLELQNWGNLSIVEEGADPTTPEFLNTKKLDAAKKALRYLNECPLQRLNAQHLSASPEELIEQTLKNQNSRLELIQTMLKIQNKIKTIRPWGYFNWPTEKHLGGQRLWFYCLSHHQKQQLPSSLCVHVVHEDILHCWIIVISPSEPDHTLIPFSRTHVGQKTLSELEKELEAAQIVLEDLEDERAAMTRWRNDIENYKNELSNAKTLNHAKQSLVKHNQITQINAWVEKSRIQELHNLIADHQGVAVPLLTLQNETPPTLLKNPAPLKAAQKLVTFFQFPNYDDWDPTPIMHISFVLFYAMILADVGYGIITVAIGIWAHIKYRNAHEWSHLIFQLGAASIAYGMLVGSYFGKTPSTNTLAHSIQLLDLNNFNQMMQLSLAIGVIHIAVGLIIKVRLRQGLEKIQSLSWLWLLSCSLPYIFAQQAIYLYCLILTPLFWLYSAIKYSAGWLNAVFLLISPFMQLSKMLGDILSYMRLFALGLASASLAITFNQLALDVREAFPGMGVLLSLLILILGHTLNFSLAIMGGVVHSMRLNCIEFFNWALDKEGYPFKPFNKI